jgi:hypothetical protein
MGELAYRVTIRDRFNDLERFARAVSQDLPINQQVKAGKLDGSRESSAVAVVTVCVALLSQPSPS